MTHSNMAESQDSDTKPDIELVQMLLDSLDAARTMGRLTAHAKWDRLQTQIIARLAALGYELTTD